MRIVTVAKRYFHRFSSGARIAGYLSCVVIAAGAAFPASAAGALQECRFKPELSAPEASLAAQDGARFALQREGYGVVPWVLYQSRDPLRAEPDRPGIDAVIVETPFERIRYESYLSRFQGLDLSPLALARIRREAAGTIGFIVYAHSRGEHDRGFMGGYSRATITLPNGRRLLASDPVRFGPSTDFYTVGTFRDTRWTGSLTYRFLLPPGVLDEPCGLAGTLRFTDGHGHPFVHQVSLAQYR